MKPEHAQEIYDMLEGWANYAPDWAKAKWNLGDDLERAKQLLGLERPDVPEPGTVVEYYISDDSYSWGSFDEMSSLGGGSYPCVITTVHRGHNTTIVTDKWRYPGEKEWRE